MKTVAALLVALVAVTSATVIAQRQVFDPGNGVTLPAVIKEVRPQYTQNAEAKRIQGSVLLRTVVEDDGRVTDVVVETSLDPELDQQAVDALNQWQFKPGTKDGKPVAVRIHVQLTFTLR